MNIKNDEAYALASEIAEMSGTSLTQAVIDALRARKRELTRETKIAAAMELCRETAALLSPKTLAFDIDKELYDENTGLPI